MADNQPVVLSERTDGVLRLRLNRPEKLNALNYEMIWLLLAELDRAVADDAIRTIVLSGEGRAFCAGDDTKGMGPLPRELSPGEHPLVAMQQALIKRWFWLRKPTVAVIHGHCHGIGQDLALAADFRVVGTKAIMGDLRAARAIPVGSGGTFLLPRMIGLAAATEIMLTGRTIDAARIERLGLASEIVKDGTLDAAVSALVRRLAAAPTKAIGQMKRELRSNLVQDLDRTLALELDVLGTPINDTLEGARSFGEGRPPVFTGT